MIIFTGNKQLLFKGVSVFILLAFMNLTMGCNYFKVHTFDSLTAEMSKSELQKYQNLNKYLILHHGDKSYHITIDKLDRDKAMLYCFGEPTSGVHDFYKPDSEGPNRYDPKRGQDLIRHEVHIFASEVNQKNNQFEIPLKSVSRIDVIEHDTGKTIASHLFIVVGIVASVLAVITLIILLTKSSCPFVYVFNGTSYDFKGEIYGGAIFKPLQRNDFMPLLSLYENDSLLQIRISNELKEIQYTDVANIIVAEHDNSINTVIDNFGNIHTIQQKISPQSAMMNGLKNVREEMMRIDSSSCLFEGEGRAYNLNELDLTFEKPENARQAKLILNAQNSLFLDFAFTEFTKLFGSRYGAFVEKQNHANRDSLTNWSVNQGIPLSVFVKKNNNWQLVEQINTVGPLAARNICVPIDVSDMKGNSLEVKLQCGFMFWEIDYAAVDFSDDVAVKTATIKPINAIEENGHDVTSLLSNSDGIYLVQPNVGNTVTVTYKIPPSEKGKYYDAFLMAGGYYNHVRDYQGFPDKDYLMTFKKKGAFVGFAKALQDKMMENTIMADAK